MPVHRGCPRAIGRPRRRDGRPRLRAYDGRQPGLRTDRPPTLVFGGAARRRASASTGCSTAAPPPWLGTPMLVARPRRSPRAGLVSAVVAPRAHPLPPRPVGAPGVAGRRLRAWSRRAAVLVDVHLSPGGLLPGQRRLAVPAGAVARDRRDPGRRAAGGRGAAAARASQPSGPARPTAHAGTAGGGGGVIELDQDGRDVRRCHRPVLSRRRPDHPRGRAGRWSSAHRVGQEHPAARPQRPGAALLRRHAARSGHVVDGRDTRTHRPRDLADVVGFVGQDPLAGFVTDTVEDELAYGMESLGLLART